MNMSKFFNKNSSSKNILDFIKDSYNECNIENIVDSYTLFDNLVTIVIGFYKGIPVYCVREAKECTEEAVKAAVELYERHIVEGYEKPDDNMINTFIKNIDKRYCNIDILFKKVKYYLEKIMYSYGKIYPLIKDHHVEEIAVDPPNYRVKVVTSYLNGIWLSTNIKMVQSEVEQIALFLARRSGRDLSLAHPYTEGLLPEGHRLTATLGREVTRYGPSVVIRKHRERPLGMPELVEQGVLSPELAAYIWALVEERKSILVVGPTASGKTTLLQAILDFTPPWSRIVSVEDTPELNLSHHPNWDSLVTRTRVGSEGEDIDLYKLAKFSLRRRPDYLVIGEIRGEEARVLTYAASSGHAAYSTFHAEDASVAVRRLLQHPFNIPPGLLASIDVIITIRRSSLRGRRVVEVVEVGYDPAAESIIFNTIYKIGTNDILIDIDKIYETSNIIQHSDLDSIIEKLNIIRSSGSRDILIKNVILYYFEKIFKGDKYIEEAK